MDKLLSTTYDRHSYKSIASPYNSQVGLYLRTNHKIQHRVSRLKETAERTTWRRTTTSYWGGISSMLQYINAMSAAAMCGSDGSCIAVLKYAADISVPALVHTVRKGCGRIVSLLLGRGVDTDGNLGRYGSELIAVIEAGEYSLLLDCEEDINSIGGTLYHC